MSSTAGKRGKRKATENEGKSAKVVEKKPRKPKGMPDFKPGQILIDLLKKQWRLGDLIGWGGFGALYYASSDIDKTVDDKASYVAKVEPHSNGPLFSELAFYQRVAKPETIRKWTSTKKLKYVGVPPYIGSGSHEIGGKKYRFLIMERFGEDVDQIFAKCNRCFHIQTVLVLAIRIINILEFIHAQGYVHADIKGSNLMMGYIVRRQEQVFLLDYGLAYRFNPDGRHKEYKEDPKRRHDGTIEFTSRDAHKGVAPSRRSDLEILGYVLLQWLCGKLPWEDNLNDKNYVMDCKIKSMENISQFLKKSLGAQNSGELEEYLKYIAALSYEEKPDYEKLRKIFQDGLHQRRFKDDGLTVKFKAGGKILSEASTEENEWDDPAPDNHEDDCQTSPLKPTKKARTTSGDTKPRPSKKRPAEASPKKPLTSKSQAKSIESEHDSKDSSENSGRQAPRGRPRKSVKETARTGEEKATKSKRGRPKKAAAETMFVDRGTSP